MGEGKNTRSNSSVNLMDPETIARNLEERAGRLSRENNPHNLGIDEVVYSIAQFIRISDRSSKAADRYSKRLILLTWAIVILTAVLAIPLIPQILSWIVRFWMFMRCAVR
jgi:hypothetical protein